MTVTAERTRRIHMLGDPSWDPSNYEYVDAFDSAPWEAFAWETKIIDNWDAVLGASPTSLFSLGQTSECHSQCDHCGAHIRYVVVMMHTPTGDHIAIGQDCATERFDEPNRISYLVKRAAQRRAAAKERAEVDAKLAAFGAAHPGLLDFFQSYSDEYEAGVRHYSDGFVLDVGRKLTKYASISDRQIEAVGKAFTRDGEKEAKRFMDSLKPEKPKSPAPTGRVTFTGELVGMQDYEGDYGWYTKIMIETIDGYKVWLTKPTGLGQAQRGDTVSVTATLKPAADDPFFARGSRPAKAFVVKAGS